MGSLENLLEAIDEMTIARNVGVPHDEVRIRYSLKKNTVDSFEEFTDVIAEYYTYHFTQSLAKGGSLPYTEAAGRAKEILEQGYRRQGGDIISAYNDAHDGTNGGLRIILDKIAEHLKTESVERYIRDAFDKYVKPNSWEDKVNIIREFVSKYSHLLSSTVRTDQPERYAQNYQEIIRAYMESLKTTSSVFRRF